MLLDAHWAYVIGSIIGIHAVRERYHMLNFYSPEKKLYRILSRGSQPRHELDPTFCYEFFSLETLSAVVIQKRKDQKISISRN